MKYDKEEKSILDAYKKGKLSLSTPSKKEIESIKVTAKKTMVKDKRITIRLYEHDYQGNEPPCSKLQGIRGENLCS